MDIKDSYLHGTVGVVKSISVTADKLKYKLADIAGTVKEVTLPVVTASANGLMSSDDKKKLDAFNSGSLKNNLVLKINSGTTEGTSLYTYNGSAAKTLDIKNGTGIGFTNNAGSLQIYNSGVRSIATGTDNGTISVNTNGTSANVAVKGLGSAAYLDRNLLAYYTQGNNYIAFNLYDSSLHSLGLGDGYIEYYDYGAWYNSKWGWVEAVNGFKGSLTGNASSATKLQTKRKLWGLDFDGTADVSGSLSGVTKIASNNTSLAIATTGTTGYIYLRYLDDNSKSVVLADTYFGPTEGSNNKLDLGKSSGKWKNVYATSFIGNLDGTYVNKLTGYTKATTASDIVATDTLNTALGKLEYKADTTYRWYQSITEDDTDDIINKWDEIVDFIDSVKEGTDITNEFVTRKTALTITGLKTFESDSETTGVSLILKNKNWHGGMSTAMDFYNGKNYNVPNARIETKMDGSGDMGGTLIFYTLTKHASINPNPNGLSERFRIGDNGISKITGALTITGNTTAAKFITSGGTSSQFVKGDGSLDSNIYATTSSLGNYVTLNTALTISGIKTFSSLLKFTVAQGTSPFTVTSNTKVANLNADLLDGKYASDFKQVNVSNISYTPNLTHHGGSTVKSSYYYKVSISNVTNIWTMLYMELDIKENYETPSFGKLIIHVNKDQNNVIGRTYGYISGRLSNDVKVYIANDSTLNIYISGSWSYPTIDVSRVHFGDSSVNVAKTISISTATTLPASYTTATMIKGLNSENYSTYTVKKDGTGATGTWNISITGNAATATRLVSPYGYTTDESKVILESTTASTLFGRDYSFSAMMKNHSVWDNYASVWNFSAYKQFGGTQFAVMYNLQPCRAAIRTYNLSLKGWGSWRELAFTDSNVESTKYILTQKESSEEFYSDRYKAYLKWINSNTAAFKFTTGTFLFLSDQAIKLTNARTIWGLGFDGTNNIADKPLSGVFESLNFSRDNWNYICVPETNGNLSFNIGKAGTANTKMCILNNGYVGIGSTIAAYPLHVVGKIYSTSGFIKENSSNNYILLGGGGHEDKSTFAKRKTRNDFIHNTNEYTFVSPQYTGEIYINYRTASGLTDGDITSYRFCDGKGGTLASITLGSFNGSASSLKASTIITSSKFNLSNAEWTDTGYTFVSLATGTYAIQVTCGNLVASGIMSVYKNVDDTAGDEIPLHVYHNSTQPWRPYLRTSGKKLLISSNDASATSRTVTIKIALIL